MKNLDQYLLNPNVTYLNHGSFGAVNLKVFKEYQEWQRVLEADSVQFFTKIGPAAIKKSREKMAEFINCEAQDLVFVPNPTFAGNIVAHNFKLEEGDEILTTDLEYGPMDRTWKLYCEKTGAKYVEAKINLPIQNKQEIIDAVAAKFSSRTKLLFISEITSTTALKLPVKELCAMAKERGVMTFVDGAHSPAHIDVDLSTLQADFYTGACHKWMNTPKGSSFLYAKREFQKMLDPLVVSWGYDAEYPGESIFLDYHQFNGTRDYSAFLTLPIAIEELEKNNWRKQAVDCNKVILDQYPRFCALLGTKPLCPVSIDFLGFMCSVPVKTDDPIALKEELFGKHNIEIPVMVHKGAVYVRISFQVYNDLEDLNKLYKALEDCIKKGLIKV